MLFSGVATALITPYKDDQIDFESMSKMIECQIAAGVTGFVACGSTGEPATMTHEETLAVVKFVVETVAHRACVIAGSGSNSTKKTCELSVECESLGADGLLIVTPYYNKCTQKGLVEHYAAVSDSVNIPIIAYNVPARTGVNIAPSTYNELVKIKNINAVKEASSNYLQIAEIASITRGKMKLYSGDDEMVSPFYPLGGSGVISVSSNIIPEVMVKICNLCEKNKLMEAQELADKYAKFNKLLFCEVNPIPVKAAAYLMNYCSDEIRLPLTKIENEHMEQLKDEMIKLGLIKRN